MGTKGRLSASVDAELIVAAQAAVDAGRSESVSAWVSHALRRQVEHDRRMAALGEFLAAYEAENGEITDEEIRLATRRAESRAVVVRGRVAETSLPRQQAR